MIARLRLLDPLQVLLQIRLGEERSAVDTREHRPGRVTAPVGARDRLQLERADAAGARRVRPAAEVGERAIRVQRHRLSCSPPRARPPRGRRSARPCSPGPRRRSARVPALRVTSSRSKASAALTCARMRSSIFAKSASETSSVGELEVVVEALARSAGRSRSSRPAYSSITAAASTCAASWRISCKRLLAALLQSRSTRAPRRAAPAKGREPRGSRSRCLDRSPRRPAPPSRGPGRSPRRRRRPWRRPGSSSGVPSGSVTVTGISALEATRQPRESRGGTPVCGPQGLQNADLEIPLADSRLHLQ